MAYNCLVSICIPCYKRTEQVRCTLKSIFVDNADAPLSDYEVVITDNDPEHEVKSVVEDFSCYPNLRYIPTDCEGFMNSYYALKNGRGELLKLHNSQDRIIRGRLNELLKNVMEYRKNKPLIFFTNGLLNTGKIQSFYDYESFMCSLSYLSSWSGGMTIWKDDFDNIGNIKLDSLFPHTSIFLTQFFKTEYIIDDRLFYKGQKIYGRGGHNKFKAFTINYPCLISKCCEKGLISVSCKNSIFKSIYKDFIPTLLFNKYIVRIETFDASGFKRNCHLYFPREAYYIAWLNVLFVPFKIFKHKIISKFCLN